MGIFRALLFALMPVALAAATESWLLRHAQIGSCGPMNAAGGLVLLIHLPMGFLPSSWQQHQSVAVIFGTCVLSLCITPIVGMFVALRAIALGYF